MNRRPPIEIEYPPRRSTTRVEMSVGATSRLGEHVASARSSMAGRPALVVGDVGAEACFESIAGSLASVGANAFWYRLEPSESMKCQATADRIVEWAIGHGVDRETPLVAVGGGIVCDLVGHVAGTLLRGVPLVLVPTTLLAMVDASIGGKTAVNVALPNGVLGRNLVGGFHPATLVVADVGVLDTLPSRELRAGLAECIKHGWIDGEEHLAWLETHAEALLGAGEPRIAALEDLTRRSIALKAGIVTRDPHERGERRWLNLGHTFAHAIEARPGNGWRHGEAVAIGLVAAGAAAEAAGIAEPGVAERIRDLVDRFGLPHALEEAVPLDLLRGLMGLDKKRTGRSLRLVLPKAPGRLELVADPAEEIVAAGWRAVGART